MTTGKEECAGMLARLAELIQACENPAMREKLVQAQALLQTAIASASEAEAAAIIRISQECLNQQRDRP